MTWSDDGSPINALRAAVNSPRGNAVAIVGGLSALSGAVAGGVAALIGAAVLTPTEPTSAAQVALMAVAYGFAAGVAGSVLGTLVAFSVLRRVALGRLLLCTNVGLAAGLTAGWLGGPWAWHHMAFLGFVGFSRRRLSRARGVSRIAGADFESAIRLCARERDDRLGTAQSGSDLNRCADRPDRGPSQAQRPARADKHHEVAS